MSVSVDNIYSSLINNQTASKSGSLLSSSSSSSVVSGLTDTSDLQNSIENATTDAEMMKACKGFESYFVEQMYKSMQETIQKTDEDGDYTSMFNDKLVEEYGKSATEGEGIGIAKMLYESMQRNQGASTASASKDATTKTES